MSSHVFEESLDYLRLIMLNKECNSSILVLTFTIKMEELSINTYRVEKRLSLLVQAHLPLKFW